MISPHAYFEWRQNSKFKNYVDDQREALLDAPAQQRIPPEHRLAWVGGHMKTSAYDWSYAYIEVWCAWKWVASGARRRWTREEKQLLPRRVRLHRGTCQQIRR